MRRRYFFKKLLLGVIGAGSGIAGYNIGTIGFSELGKTISDTFKTEIKKDPRKLDDSHAHFYNIPKNELELKMLLELMLHKTDRQAITFKIDSDKILKYKDLAKMIEDFSSKNKVYEFTNKGLISVIKKGSFKTEVYQSQEIRTSQGFHIIAEGCENPLHNNLDARKTVEEIHKQKGIAIIAHPFTVERGPLVFWYPNNNQIKLLKEELIPAADSVEAFNAKNNLYMILSNAKIKYLLKDYFPYLKGIAVTDMQGREIKDEQYQIGRSGILYENFDTGKLTDRETFELKRSTLNSGDYDLFENYIDLATFLNVILD